MRSSAVIWNRDANPEVARTGTVEPQPFALIPDPPELLSEDEFAERMIQAVNIPGDDWNGDGLDGYANSDLFHLT
jgi:hypothetical protein